MLKLLTVLVLWFFVQPVFAQKEKTPELPDYTKWELSEWHLEKVLYKGKLAYGLYEHHEFNQRLLVVVYKPISKEVYDNPNPLTGDNRDRQVHVLAGKEPLFIYYIEKEYGPYVYIYERTRKFYEFYRLWQVRWKPVRRFTNPAVSEDYKDAEAISKFIERRYEFRWEN